MKKLIKSTHAVLFFGFCMFFILLIYCPNQCCAQSRTTLNQEEIDALNTLYELKYIAVKTDGWEINPDAWSSFNFTQRKNFTEKLSVYYKNYTEIGKQMSGFCYFYNMATKKKIARWYKNEYLEY